MTELNEVQKTEESPETQQINLAEQNEERKSLLLSIVKSNYARKTAKHNKLMGKFKDRILVLSTDKSLLESKISSLENKINLENSAIIALCNSNNYLESVKGQSFHIDNILIFLAFGNNRKRLARERKVEQFKAEIAQLREREISIEKEIVLLNQKISKCESEISRFDLRQQNIAAIEKLNIANPAISFFLAKNSEEAAADISKYCYKEVPEDKLSSLEGFGYKLRRSKTNEKMVIIRFEKEYKEQFEKALA